ncbi:unnamed protein product [Urochloa humidicola]
MDRLPEDLLGEVLSRTPPHSLAVCRCVCRAWRAAVDARRLLLPHVLPHSVRGIFSNYCDHGIPHFFARPRGTGPRIDGTFSSIPNGHHFGWNSVLDHCNGLILFDYQRRRNLFVCNPVTRRWAQLPPPLRQPRPNKAYSYRGCSGLYYLAFDPSVSLHYEVFLIPEVPGDESPEQQNKETHNDRDSSVQDSSVEWPPLLHLLQVFSSRTQQWEDRTFVREGGPAGTVAEVRVDSVEPAGYGTRYRYAEYWRGALYVHMRGAYVMRLPLTEDKYQVIKTPTNIEENKHIHPYLGRSVNGVCYATMKKHELRVWTLDESEGQKEWALKHHVNLEALTHQIQWLCCYCEQVNRPWTIVSDSDDEHEMEGQEANSDEDLEKGQPVKNDDDQNELEDQEIDGQYANHDEEDEVEGQVVNEWDSDDDDILDIDESNWKWGGGVIYFLGFHPYKEVVFLGEMLHVVAYHLRSSKAQYLGCNRPNGYYGS